MRKPSILNLDLDVPTGQTCHYFRDLEVVVVEEAPAGQGELFAEDTVRVCWGRMVAVGSVALAQVGPTGSVADHLRVS